MITIHHLNNSRSQRILWMLEELELEYDIVSYQRNPVTGLAPTSLRQIHPLGKSPVLVHEGRTVVESGAIIEYISANFDRDHRLTPDDVGARTEATMWVHYAEGSIMTPIMLNLIFSKIASTKMPLLVRPVANQVIHKLIQGVHDRFLDEQITLHSEYMAKKLTSHDYFVGNKLTLADIAMSFPLETIATKDALGPIPQEIKEIFTSYVRRIQSRPAYQRALARGGKYDYLVS